MFRYPLSQGEQQCPFFAVLAHEELLNLKPATLPPANTDEKRVRAAATGKACGFGVEKKPLVGIGDLIRCFRQEQFQSTSIRGISRRPSAPTAHGKIISVLIRFRCGSQDLGHVLRVRPDWPRAGWRSGVIR